MSYSFTVRASTKQLALAAVAAKFAEVVAAQACHERDKPQALAAAEAFVGLLPDDADRDVTVGLSGYLSGTWQGSDVVDISAANVSVSAGLVQRLQGAA